jgi:hypothetical protein
MSITSDYILYPEENLVFLVMQASLLFEAMESLKRFITEALQELPSISDNVDALLEQSKV